MTFSQFNKLDQREQAEILCDTGVAIANREDSFYWLFLYQIDGFYCEIGIHKEKNIFPKFRTFSSMSQLEPYLKQIGINNLIAQRKDLTLNDFQLQQNKAAAEAVQSMLKHPLSLEQSIEQLNRMAKRSEIEFAKEAPEIQKRVKLITTPLQFKDSVKIYQWLWRKQITLEMIPSDVLKEFLKTEHYRILVREKKKEKT